MSEAAEPAEVARGDRRQQIEPDVRGRRAVRDDRLRDPPGSCRAAGRCRRADEGLEEPPGAACRGTEGPGVRWATSRGVGDRRGGRLTHRATEGREASRARGTARRPWRMLRPRTSATSAATATARIGAPRMRRYAPLISRDDVRLGLGGRRPIRAAAGASETRRTSVRTIASLISHAWCARNVRWQAIWDPRARSRARRLARAPAWRCPGAVGTSSKNGGQQSRESRW